MKSHHPLPADPVDTELLRQLELATSSRPTAGAELNSTDEPLHEGWQALTRAAQASETPFDEAGFLSQLRAGLAAYESVNETTPSHVVGETSTSNGAGRFSETWLGIGAALTVLIVATLLSVRWSMPIAAPDAKATSHANINLDKSPAASSEQHPPLAQHGVDSSRGTASSVSQQAADWQEGIDETIWQMQTTVAVLNDRTQRFDASLNRIGWQVRQMTNDLGADSLQAF